MSSEEVIKVLEALYAKYEIRGRSDTLQNISPELAEWNIGVSDGIQIALELLSGEPINLEDFI